MERRAVTDLTINDLATLPIPPVRADDPTTVRNWKETAIQAQKDIQKGGRGDITVHGAAASLRLAVVQLRNEGVSI